METKIIVIIYQRRKKTKKLLIQYAYATKPITNELIVYKT